MDDLLSDVELTDDELTELALAAAPDPDLTDAVPFRLLDGPDGELLPAWYMPAPASSMAARPGWRRRIAIVVIVAFLLIDAAGLCSTYGPVSFG